MYMLALDVTVGTPTGNVNYTKNMFVSMPKLSPSAINNLAPTITQEIRDGWKSGYLNSVRYTILNIIKMD